LVETVRQSYENYSFHLIFQAVNTFCTVDMSKLYIDIIKDRLYVEGKTSFERRSAQTALYEILSGLTRMIAPILAFTADELWEVIPHTAQDDTRAVLLNEMPSVCDAYANEELEDRYNALFDLRDTVMKALEIARADKLIGKSLDAKVTVYTNDNETYALLDSFKSELPSVYIVSAAQIVLGDAPEGAITEEGASISVLVEVADGERCDRCWLHSTECVYDGEGYLCPRCRAIVGE
jgi:isoleucyl-tRNA synthetase